MQQMAFFLRKGIQMRTYSLKTFIFLFVILSQSCALIDLPGRKVSIESTPPGAIITRQGDDGQINTLGKAPLEIQEEKLFENNEMILLQATLGGFRDTAVYIPQIERLSKMAITFRLEETPLSESKNSDQTNSLVSEIAKAQSLIHQKRFTMATASLEKLSTQFPEIAVIRDLLGNTFYLSGKTKEALEMYLKAEIIDPNNSARKTIINKLKEQ